MKLHHFRDVVTIAEQGSIRAAARHLNLAQPALTRSLGELERELGTPLFERRGRGMTLTPIGHRFLKRAVIILADVNHARAEVDQLTQSAGGTVVVGLSIAAHLSFLPRVLRPFMARFPRVRLHVIEGFYPTLEAGLRSGTVDLYVGPQPEGRLPSDLHQEELFSNTRTILCRKGHPLADRRSLRDLVDAEWATTSITMEAGEEFRHLFELHGLSLPRLALQSQSALTLMVAIASTDLLAMVPRQWSDFALTAEALASIRVDEPLPAPPITMVMRSGAPLTPAATHVADLIQKVAALAR